MVCENERMDKLVRHGRLLDFKMRTLNDNDIPRGRI